MKRQKENTSSYSRNSGITITDSISLTFNSKSGFNSKLILIITALAGVIGFNLSFLSLFDFECSRSMIYTAEAMAFIVSSVICLFASKARLLFVPVYILMMYGIYRTRLEISYGYACFINTISEKLAITSTEQPYYNIPETADELQCLTLFLMFVFMIITIALCYNTIVKPRFILVFSITFPFIETGLLFGFSPDHLSFSLLISYWMAVFAMRIAGNQYHSESGKPVFVRRKNIFVSSGNLRNNVIEDIGIITLISVFSIFFISHWATVLLNPQRPQKVIDARHNIKSAMADFSIEKLANNMDDDADMNPAMEESQVGNISRIIYQDKTDLTVYLSDKPAGNLYLKGFTGAIYDKNTWYSITENEKNSELFKSFENSGSYPQYYNYRNSEELSRKNRSFYTKMHVIVNSWFKTNKYAFVPYNVAPAEGLVPDKDAYFRTDNLNSYAFDMYSTPELYKNMDFIYRYSNNLVSGYTEEKYREYVYETYLLLPESDSMNKLANEYSYITDYNGKNISEIYSEIKDILFSSADYSLEPGKTPVSAEVTSYMLNESHKGYCSHFATSAVVLARLNGIPARYAEGYILTPDDINYAESVNAYYKLDIQDTRAHAWAEFYIDGYGWVPFEFTPGYDQGIISAEEALKSASAVTVTEAVTTPEETTAVTEAVTEAEIITEIVTVAEPVNPVSEVAPDFTEIADNGTDSAGDMYDDNRSGNDDGSRKQAGKIMSALLTVLRMIFSVVITVALAAALLFTRHILCLRKRIMSFRSKSANKSMTAIYNYGLDLLNHIEIRKGNMLPLEFAEHAEEKAAEYLEKGRFTILIQTALKAGYSSEQISPEEIRECENTVNTLAKNIYKSKNRRDRFIFRYILNMCK